ncbi:hypothetical protein [Vannielia litorea]|uniref:hypothetical protein n=1 Tax=Vannielia litorea TaxID=1217970 RepID=UPI001C95697E|nr:hypothetical protein [Vannielia litorea]MBY6046349.1 hypothetical protein [Vannielia litorea]MBY6073762.1 hypothetical protein [Vannielia litorea]
MGRTAELAPAELAAVTFLRMALTGRDAQVAEDFALLLGAQDGAEAHAAFARLARALAERPRAFCHHAPGCACYGGDESAFAHLLSASAAGDEEAAMGFALHLFSGRPPLGLLGAAARAGLALNHMAEMLSAPRALH